MKLFESKQIVKLKEAVDTNERGLMTLEQAKQFQKNLESQLSKISGIKDHFFSVGSSDIKNDYLTHYGGNDVFVKYTNEKDPKKWSYGYATNDPAATFFRVHCEKGVYVSDSWQTPSYTNHIKAGLKAYKGITGTEDQVIKSIVDYVASVVKNADKFPTND